MNELIFFNRYYAWIRAGRVDSECEVTVTKNHCQVFERLVGDWEQWEDN